MKQQEVLFIVALLALVAVGFLLLSSKFHALPAQTTKPTPSTTLQKSGWKQFDNSNYNFGISFNYPADWKASQGNAGPIFVSPDRKLIFSIAGPYINDTDTFDKLALRVGRDSQVVSKSNGTILGHPAIRQELLSSNGNDVVDSVNEYIGNIKNISHWQDGTPNIEYGTIILGMTIMDKFQHDKAITIFNQILFTIKFAN